MIIQNIFLLRNILIAGLMLLGSYGFSGKAKIMISTSEPDAKIYYKKELLGTGQACIEIDKEKCKTIVIQKDGYFSVVRKYCNKKGFAKLPENEFILLEKDDAFLQSKPYETVNNDVLINPTNKKDEIEIWRILHQNINEYFDVVEISERETGYLRTAWVEEKYKQSIVRTRLIVKLGSVNPLAYKVKIMSERSINKDYDPENNGEFVKWNRLSINYVDLIPNIRMVLE